VRAAGDDGTRVTRAYTGRPARGIVNALGDALAPFEAELPPYPLMHLLTRDIRAASARRGDPALMSLWAGQGAGLATTDLPAAELFQRLVTETDALLR
jgi:nitronate monooxygenase